MTIETVANGLALASRTIATRAALAFMRDRGLDFGDLRPLNEAIGGEIKRVLSVALEDAREALACGMEDAAEQTFAASMALAGIAAVKSLDVYGKPIVEVHPEG